ncbi:beta-1,4-N-acetylgalactosaminyltransferase 3 isoform X2 [Archocentrus centrarchus]|nr:beta-1,4-N-acetylgalactosaminyltransferase 3-like isoform X2 [Archocentrus centrarchus]XP_030587122.1 beta-1,4-N-acetylgalactosaminyltransferase 3-like isoform X2 [Archocentrus centrarchus]
MGQANLHVFEDWCGSSTADLRKNLHYPLYPHSRITVRKLAVSPQWTNYGLRIFGYLHPYADGDFVFAVSSDDNSEFWLSTDDSPLNLQLQAWVGRTGKEWSAPGEFEKYASQNSRPVRLSAQMRYFFEVIHKQNDRGTDHVEVAWLHLDQDSSFMIIESKYISLYTDESALLMNDVSHIPQTAASHWHTPTKQRSAEADMLIEDRRDSFYKVHMLNSKFLQGVLPDCTYKPSYTIKDLPLHRYQGLQFVHLSYIYPNDYTRLTHMEMQTSCFYSESSYYLKMFGFSRYMKLDRPKERERLNRDFNFQGWKRIQDKVHFHNETYEKKKEVKLDDVDNGHLRDYGDEYNYVQNGRRKLFSLVVQKSNNTLGNSSYTRLRRDMLEKRENNGNLSQSQSALKQGLAHNLQQNHTELQKEGPVKKPEQIQPKLQLKQVERQKVKSPLRPEQANPLILDNKKQLKEKSVVQSEQLDSKQHRIQKTNHSQIQRVKSSQLQNLQRNNPHPEKPILAKQRRFVTREKEFVLPNNKRFTPSKRNFSRPLVRSNQRDSNVRKRLTDKEIELNMPLQQDLENSIPRAKKSAKAKMDKKWMDKKKERAQGREEDEVYNRAKRRRNTTEDERDYLWRRQGEFDNADDEDLAPAPVVDIQVNWNQTFQASPLDLQAQRSDWINLQCNISGNLLLHSNDALDIVKTFMDKLNAKHHGQFKLVRVVNVVKRADRFQGSRYLLELELKDVNGQLLRLSQYIYALVHHGGLRNRDFSFKQSQREVLLCNPVGFHWNPVATVHFVVPVKNQAKWVQQLITDMEELFRKSRDANFNLIITDYNSTDMDVRKALQKSSLPSYQYVKLSGNFERSAGLQAGIDLITDDHSIVFLCDLHIQFPPSIIDTIRKHCVEGYMAFAPIVMRLDCGATPLEARGYWEVNGFGLLGIYKSDLDKVGGMNTKDFTERWGGEDWELLDRILQAGLEVERIYLRNFFHHYHSKRGMWNRRMSTSPR